MSFNTFGLLLLLVNSSASSKLIQWKFSYGDINGFIVTSMHYISESDSSNHVNDLHKLLDNVDLIFFETEQTEVKPSKNLFFCDNETICGKDTIKEKSWKLIVEDFSSDKNTVEYMKKLKPWSLSMFLGQLRSMGEVGKGLEHQILALNAEHNHPVFGLQSINSLFHSFDSLSIHAQTLMLKDSLVDKSNHLMSLKKISSNWTKGKKDNACSIVEKIFFTRKEYTEKIVFERNKLWVSKLKNLKSKEPVLVVIGLAHVCGELNFISLLQNAGFTLTRLN